MKRTLGERHGGESDRDSDGSAEGSRDREPDGTSGGTQGRKSGGTSDGTPDNTPDSMPDGTPGPLRSARFVCAVAAAWPDGTVKTAVGVMEGRIAYEIAGANGFGYDPIFYLPEYGKTSAEISPEEKNAISHRGKAFRKMREILVAFAGVSV